MIGSKSPAILKKIEPTIKPYKSIRPISSIASETSFGKESNKPSVKSLFNFAIVEATAAS